MAIIPTQVTATMVFDTSRMLLNDTGIQLSGSPGTIQLWTDEVLMPMMYQAHLELQQKLKSRAAPVMKGFAELVIAPFTPELLNLPSDLTSPIQIWEKPLGAPIGNYQLMTETDILPIITPVQNLTYWAWIQDTVMFVGASISTQIVLVYWRRIPVPTVGNDPIRIIDGEQYLAPRIAALAAASVGEDNTSQVAGALAEAQLQIVLSANRSRAPQNIGISIHP